MILDVREEMANKRIITGKTTGNFILKGVVKVIGRSLDGLGFNVKSLSKSHAVRKMKNLSPTVMCPNVTVSIAEMIMNKNVFAEDLRNMLRPHITRIDIFPAQKSQNTR